MTKANVIGTQFTATLELPSGEIRRVNLSETAYRNISENTLQTTLKASERRAKFVVAVEEPLFDTSSGFLEIDCYSEKDEDKYWFNEEGVVLEIGKEFVVNDQITDRTKILWL